MPGFSSLLFESFSPDGISSQDIANRIAIGTDGAIHLAGWTEGNLDGIKNGGLADAFIIKLNPNGSKAWIKLWSTSGWDEARGVIAGPDRDF